MNLLPGDAAPQRRRGAAWSWPTARARCRCAGAGGSDGQPVIYGTRPEHLSLAADGGMPVAGGGHGADRRRHAW